MTRAESHALLGGKLKLLQAPTGHRVGTDAVLLAAAAPPIDRGLIIDLGCGVGAVGLIAALSRATCDIHLVDNDPDALALAASNIALNNLGDRVSTIDADILSPAREQGGRLAPESASLVLTNPPYGVATRMRASPDRARAAAHIMPPGGLAIWLASAADALKPRGELVMIHRADTLVEALVALAGRFGSIAIKPVQPRAGDQASRILIRAIKGGRAPLSLLPPLVLHDGDRFTTEADAIHRGEAAISF